MIQEWLLIASHGDCERVIRTVHCDTLQQASAKVKAIFGDASFGIRIVKGVTFKTFEDFEQNRHHYENISDCKNCPYVNSKHNCRIVNAICPTIKQPTWCPLLENPITI